MVQPGRAFGFYKDLHLIGVNYIRTSLSIGVFILFAVFYSATYADVDISISQPNILKSQSGSGVGSGYTSNCNCDGYVTAEIPAHLLFPHSKFTSMLLTCECASIPPLLYSPEQNERLVSNHLPGKTNAIQEQPVS